MILAKKDAPKKGAAKSEEYPGKRTLYVVEGQQVKRERKHCPKCGPGVFMAVHKDRAHCGRCGYTEFAKKE